MSSIQQQVEKIIKELKIKVDTDTHEARVDEYKWKIKNDAHVDPIRMQVVELQDEFKERMEELEANNASKRMKIELTEKINKEILELVLIGFNYEEAAKNPKIGPIVLDYLTKELTNFLVEQGGLVGYQHSLTLSRLVSLISSVGTMASKKSMKSSGSQSPQEQISSESTD